MKTWTFWQKIKILGQNRNSGPKFKVLAKNRNFGQKSKFGQKIEILDKNQNLDKRSKFREIILVKNRSFDQKSKLWQKMKILDKNRKFLWKINWFSLENKLIFFKKFFFLNWFKKMKTVKRNFGKKNQNYKKKE